MARGLIYGLIKIALIAHTIFYRGLNIAHVFYAKKFCRCPACREFYLQEDVRITYGDKTMNIKSTKWIKSSKLQEYFGISLINGTYLGIQIPSGEICNQLKHPSSNTRLNAGEYFIKILTVISTGKPEYSCADCGTCTPWGQIGRQMRESEATKTIIVG